MNKSCIYFFRRENRRRPVPMTTMIGGELQCQQEPDEVAGESVQPACVSSAVHARKCADRRPVVELVHLPIDYFRQLRHPADEVRLCDVVAAVHGRRPSDVYGEAARRRWTETRKRPKARSAAAIRGARLAKLSVGATDSLTESSMTCALQSPLQESQHDDPAYDTEKTDDTVTGVDSPHSTSVYPEIPVTSSEPTASQDYLDTYEKKLHGGRSAAKLKFKAVPSPEVRSDVGIQQHLSTDCVETSSSMHSKSNRKRTALQESLPKRTKKSQSKTSKKTNNLDDENTQLCAAELDSELRKDVQHEDGAYSLLVTAPANEDSNDLTVDTNDALSSDDTDTLAVVPIDVHLASSSVAAVDKTDPTQHTETTLKAAESLTLEHVTGEAAEVDVPVNQTSLPSSLNLPSSDNIVESTTELDSKPIVRDERTIFERFIDALSLHKPKRKNHVEETVVHAAIECDPVSVTSAEVETGVDKNANDLDSEQVPVADVSEITDTSTMTFYSPLPTTITDVDLADTSDNVPSDVDKSVAVDGVVESHDDDGLISKTSDTESNDETAPDGIGGNVLGVKTDTQSHVASTYLASRPVRNRQPTIRSYEDVFLDYSFQPRHRKGGSVKPAGSCLLPPDFFSPAYPCSKTAQKSWKTSEKRNSRPAKTNPAKPSNKTKRTYSRRPTLPKPAGRVEWTINKKLLLGEPAPALAATSSKKKRKPKSRAKKSSVGSYRDELVTRSKTRQRKTRAGAVHHSCAETTKSLTAAASLLSAEVGASSALNEVDDTKSELCGGFTAAHVTGATCSTTTVTTVPTANVPTSTTTTSSLIEQFSKSPARDVTVELAVDESRLACEEETEPDIDGDDVACSADVDVSAATGVLVTTDSETNTDTTKVDDESVEALMQLIKQLQDAVVNEKVRKAKEKMRARRSHQGIRPVKSTSSVDESKSWGCGPAAALALGLGPRFNWLEKKINTMQATSNVTKAATRAAGAASLMPKLRPLLPKPMPIEATSIVSSVSVSGATTVSTVSVATVSTSTSSTVSTVLTTAALQRHCVVSNLATNKTDTESESHVQLADVTTVVEDDHCMSFVHDDETAQPKASQQANPCTSVDIGPLVIDLEDSSDTSSGLPSASVLVSCAVTHASEHSPEDHYSRVAAAAAAAEVESRHLGLSSETTTKQDDAKEAQTADVVVDLTTCSRQLCAVTAMAMSHNRLKHAELNDSSADALHTVSASPSSVVMLEEYNRRFQKYERLCALITLKDRELLQLKVQQQRVYQLLEETRLSVSTSTESTDDKPAPAADQQQLLNREEQQEKKDEVAHAVTKPPASTVAPAPVFSYRHRPAHRGVTSVRVMVKSMLPPTAHTTRMNLSRYNSLFCNYDEAASQQRPPTQQPSTAANEGEPCRMQPADLTCPGPKQTEDYAVQRSNTSIDVVERSTAAAESRHASNVVTCVAAFHGPSDDLHVAYGDHPVASSEARATNGGRLDVEQRSGRYADGCPMSRSTVIESPAAVVAASNTGRDDNWLTAGVPGNQRLVRHYTDVGGHAQLLSVTTSEPVVMLPRSQPGTDDHRAVASQSAVQMDTTPVFLSSDRYRTGVDDRTVAALQSTEQRQLRQPPPYSQHQALSHPLVASAAPGVVREQTGIVEPPGSHLDHSSADAVAFTNQKQHPVGPRTVYVQPMRAENRDVAPVHPACDSIDADAVVWQTCSAVPSSGDGRVNSKRILPSMSPPQLPTRMVVQHPVDTSQLPVVHTYHMCHPAPDFAAQRPKLVAGPPDTRFSYVNTSRSALEELPPRQLPTATVAVVQQRYTTPPSTRDGTSQHPGAERRPLHQLAQFVDGRQQYSDAGGVPRGSQLVHALPADSGDPRLQMHAGLPLTQQFQTVASTGRVVDVNGRSVGVNYAQMAPVPSSVPANGGFPSSDAVPNQRSGPLPTSYYAQSGYQSRFPVPPGALHQRDPPPTYPRLEHSPRASVPSNNRVSVPLDMSAARQQRRSAPTFAALSQRSPVASAGNQRLNSVEQGVVAQGYGRHTPVHQHYMTAHRQEVHRRPAVDPYGNYAQVDTASSIGSSLNQAPDVARFLTDGRGLPPQPPHAGASQYPGAEYVARRRGEQLDHEVAVSMRCEVCSRPAMFICSACKKASYCSVDCQAKSWRQGHSTVCRRSS